MLTAAADLAAGTVLGPDDLTTVHFASGTAPHGVPALGEAVGRTLAAPLREGEPVTDVRLVGPGLLDAEGIDRVAVPVRVPDAQAVALLRVGDRLNLLSTDPRGGGTVVVARGVRVLALPAQPTPAQATAGGDGVGLGGRLLVLSASSQLAEQMADAGVRGYLSINLT
ncbi:Conserved secreted hypothetical protein, putative SAF domain [metagenome]|uniref:SAF domain-containing protein n=1 Tax=metagenome TaxID=256318 RepID=A0A2P2C746_9ZZZZ